MKWTIKYCLICISLFGIFSTKSYSKDAIFQHPDSLFNAGNLIDARIEFEKIIFLDKSRDVQIYALLQKANCYKQEHDFGNASATLNRIYTFNLPDSSLFAIKYEKALMHYLNNNAGMALVELQALQTKARKNEELARIQFLMSLCHLNLKDWESSKLAAKVFIQILIPNEAMQANYLLKLESLYAKKNIPKQLSAKKAQNLSRFFPGTGQFYAGKIGEGLISFTLHASLLYFGINQFSNRFYFTGYTAGFGLLHRIHTGNLQRVQDIVGKVNKENNDRFFRETFQFLSEVANSSNQTN